ncbi:hypothetical protein HN011_011153 [Eciton burchellii]|nr:hypothetical protein HN011_011153 [Eciton burchellii]
MIRRRRTLIEDPDSKLVPVPSESALARAQEHPYVRFDPRGPLGARNTACFLLYGLFTVGLMTRCISSDEATSQVARRYVILEINRLFNPATFGIPLGSLER